MSENTAKQNRYVAYFDMLGLKTATLKNPSEAWEALSALRHCMDEILKLKVQVSSRNIVLINRIKAFILADSILIFTGEDTLYDLSVILTLTSELFSRALNKCVPLRGAITHGEFFYNLNLNLFCGIPFVRAYELEKKAQWSGVIVDNDVFDHYEKWKSDMPKCMDGSSIIVPWNIPLKDNGQEKGMCLDWVKPHKGNFKIRPPILVKDYYEAFIKLFGEYEQLTPEVQAKYKNTVEFVNHSLK